MGQKKLKAIFKSDKFSDLTDKLDDLTRISDVIKFKIDSEDIVIYSLVGESTIHAFKSYKLKTDDYIVFSGEPPETLNYIVDGAKKFVKNMKFFTEGDIKAEFNYKDDDSKEVYTRMLSLKDKRFKYSNIGSEANRLRDISKYMLDSILDEDNVEWNFNIHKDDFTDIKKLSAINADDKIVTFSVDSDNNLNVGESHWTLKVGESDEHREDITFPKKYLNSISNECSEELKFKVYPSFILFKDNDINLMVSFEQSFDDEDE